MTLNFDNEEDNRKYWTLEAMLKYGGSFVKALATCMQMADMGNFEKMKDAFPEYWSQYEGVGKELEKQMPEK